MKAISVRQPWTWAILYAGKRLENRDWPDGYPALAFRGRVLLHSSKTCTQRDFGDACAFMHDRCGITDVPELADLPRGYIVGAMTIGGIVEESSDPWFMGPRALVIENVVALAKPVPCKGALGYFDVPADVAKALREAA